MREIRFVSTRPLPIVFATAVAMRAPMKFQTAKSIIACVGMSALVAILVAITLTVSWKPLTYSKTKAMTTMQRTRVMTSGIPQNNPSNDVPSIAAAIHHLLVEFKKVLDD